MTRPRVPHQVLSLVAWLRISIRARLSVPRAYLFPPSSVLPVGRFRRATSSYPPSEPRSRPRSRFRGVSVPDGAPSPGRAKTTRFLSGKPFGFGFLPPSSVPAVHSFVRFYRGFVLRRFSSSWETDQARKRRTRESSFFCFPAAPGRAGRGQRRGGAGCPLPMFDLTIRLETRIFLLSRRDTSQSSPV